MDELEKYQLNNPLIVMMCIDGTPKLPGIGKDYQSMIRLFVNKWGYKFVYQTNKNQIVFFDKTKLRQEGNKYPNNYKINWTVDEIDSFVKNVKTIIELIRPNGLVFIISSHGDCDRVITATDGEEYPLYLLYSEFYNNKTGCPYLANKPKLFFVDACQGQKRPVPSAFKGSNNTTYDIAAITSDINTNTDSVEPTVAVNGDGGGDVSKMINSSLSSSSSSDSIVNNNKPNDHNNHREIVNEDKKSDDESKEKTTEIEKDKLSKSTKQKKVSKKKKQDIKEINELMSKNYLEWENFCYVYPTLENYASVDSVNGGYLIRGINCVMKQNDITNCELNQIIAKIRSETSRLVKGEPRKSDINYKPSNSIVRQIASHETTLGYELYFGKK